MCCLWRGFFCLFLVVVVFGVVGFVCLVCFLWSFSQRVFMVLLNTSVCPV